MKMMNWLNAFFVLVMLTACKQKGAQQFVIKGQLKNAPATLIYLEQISYDNMPPQVVDSCTIVNGSFQLKGNATEESLLQLRFPNLENGPLLFVINDEETIQFSGDWNDMRKLRFTKSAASERLRSFVDSLAATQQKVVLLNQELEQATGMSDSVKNIKQQNLNQLVESFRSYVKQTALQDQSPMVSMFATTLNTGKDVSENEALFNQLIKRFPKHAGIQVVVNQFRESLATAKKQKQDADAGKPGVGAVAPDITMPDVKGVPFSLSKLKGKYVLIDFWASWCGPCRAENPNVVSAYTKFKNKNFTVLGVSLDKSKEAWLEAIKNDGLTWYHISDLKFWESGAVSLYGFSGIPYNVLIDPQGKILATDLRGAALEQKLMELLP